MEKTYYKTASLISNSCKAIALLAGQTSEVAVLAFEYGKNLVGTSFDSFDQLVSHDIKMLHIENCWRKGLYMYATFLFQFNYRRLFPLTWT